MKVGEWPRVTLSSVSVVFTDGDWIESKDQSPTGIRLIQTGNVGVGEFKDRAEKARYISEDTFRRLRCEEIYEGDCLVSRLPDPVGRACIIPTVEERLITAVDCTIIRFNTSKVCPDYFRYFSQSSDYLADIESACTGATRKRISRNKLGEIRLPLPPLPEQKSIVAILDQALEGIDTAVANAEKNLANARELFESQSYLVFAHGKSVWQKRRLGDICERITKGSSPKWQGISYLKEPGILFVTSENVGEYRMILDDPKYVEARFNDKDRKSILKNGDVLTNIVGASIGRTAIFDIDDVANINQAVCVIRCDAKHIYNKFLTYLLNSPSFKELLHDNEVDNARANLSLGFFSDLMIPVPSIEEQKNIVQSLEGFRAETENLRNAYEQRLATLAQLKMAILKKAFAGELTAHSPGNARQADE